MSEKKTITVKLVRSVISTRKDHRETVRGLGLRRLNSTAVLEDTPAVRGMIRQVSFLVEVADATPAEIEAASKALAARSARKAKVAR